MSELRIYLLVIGVVILALIYFFGRKRQEQSSHDVFADAPQDKPADALIPSRKVPSMENPGLFTGSQNHSTEASSPPLVAEPSRVEPRLDDWEDPTEETEALPEPVELTDRVLENEFLTDEVENEVEETLTTHEEDTEPESASIESQAEPEPEPELELEPESTEKTPDTVIVMFVVAKPGTKIPGRQALRAFHAHKLRFGEHDIYHRQSGVGKKSKIIFSLASMLKPGTLKPSEMNGRDLQGLSLFMKTEGLSDPRGAYDDMVHVALQLADSLNAEVKDGTLTELTHEKIVEQRDQL